MRVHFQVVEEFPMWVLEEVTRIGEHLTAYFARYHGEFVKTSNVSTVPLGFPEDYEYDVLAKRFNAAGALDRDVIYYLGSRHVKSPKATVEGNAYSSWMDYEEKIAYTAVDLQIVKDMFSWVEKSVIWAWSAKKRELAKRLHTVGGLKFVVHEILHFFKMPKHPVEVVYLDRWMDPILPSGSWVIIGDATGASVFPG